MKYTSILMVGIVCLLLVSCTPLSVPENKRCNSDSDCVPASCCHANESVNSAGAPNCQGMLCTQECVPNTLDCGQGEIKCLNNGCQVVLIS